MARKRISKKQRKDELEKITEKKKARRKQMAFGSALLMVIIIVLAAVLYKPPSNSPSDPQTSVKAGDPTPDFSFTDTNDFTYDLSGLQGKTVLLNLIEITSCDDCILEMEQLKKVYSSYGLDELIIVTININSSETVDQLKEFKTNHGGDWIFAQDPGSVKKEYAPEKLPSTFIIDRKGIVAYPDLGLTNSKSLSSLIDSLSEVGNKVGQYAPNFQLVDLNGNEFSLYDFRGKVIVIDLMATWCGPCITEMGHLKDIFSSYSHDDVWIMSIDVDDTETKEQLTKFKNDYGDDWTFATKGSAVGSAYGVSGIPQMYIIDADGVIAYKNTGVTSASDLSAEINKLL